MDGQSDFIGLVVTEAAAGGNNRDAADCGHTQLHLVGVNLGLGKIGPGRSGRGRGRRGGGANETIVAERFAELKPTALQRLLLTQETPLKICVVPEMSADHALPSQLTMVLFSATALRVWFNILQTEES